MIDRSEPGIGFIAMVFAWYGAVKMGLWFALHPWTEKAAQGLFTIMLGVATVVVQHYVRRYLYKRAPIKEAPAEATEAGEKSPSDI